MGFFDGKSRAQKQEEKLQRFVTSHHLESLNKEDAENARLIALGLMGNNLIEWGNILSGEPKDTAKLSYLCAITNQNWMIINQLDRLNKKIDKLLESQNK